MTLLITAKIVAKVGIKNSRPTIKIKNIVIGNNGKITILVIIDINEKVPKYKAIIGTVIICADKVSIKSWKNILVLYFWGVKKSCINGDNINTPKKAAKDNCQLRSSILLGLIIKVKLATNNNKLYGRDNLP